MTDTENPLSNVDCNCASDPSCCTPPSPGLSRNWKTVIFTVVVLVAIGVSAYSLIWKGPNAGSGGCGSGCVISTGIPRLDQQFIGVDFALVVITGNQPSSEISSVVGAVAADIMDSENIFRVVNLADDDPMTSSVLEKYELIEFPVVIALGRAGNAVFVQEEITEEALLGVYQRSCATAAACNPALEPDTKGDE